MIITHEELLNFGQSYGVFKNAEGICFGVGGKGIDAVLCNQMPEFKKHFSVIASFLDEKNETSFEAALNELREKRKKNQVLTKQELEIEEIPAFLENIELVSRGARYSMLFEESKELKFQSVMDVDSLVSSNELAKGGGKIEEDILTNVCTRDELIDFFLELYKIISKKMGLV